MSAKFIYVVGAEGTGKTIITEALEFFYRTHRNRVLVVMDPEPSCATRAMLQRAAGRHDFVIVASSSPAFSIAPGGRSAAAAMPAPWRMITCEKGQS